MATKTKLYSPNYLIYLIDQIPKIEICLILHNFMKLNLGTHITLRQNP